jgi:photosystem I subunit 6
MFSRLLNFLPTVLQNKFFETFAGTFSKRGLLLKFLVLGGATTVGYLGSTSSPNLLAIKNGPKQAPVIGPRNRV